MQMTSNSPRQSQQLDSVPCRVLATRTDAGSVTQRALLTSTSAPRATAPVRPTSHSPTSRLPRISSPRLIRENPHPVPSIWYRSMSPLHL